MKYLTTQLSLVVTLLTFLFSSTLFAQCPLPGITYGSTGVAPTSPGMGVVIGSCQFVGEYATVTGVQAGRKYVLS